MKCKVCGEELPERAQFCFTCGAQTEEGAGEKDEREAASEEAPAEDAPVDDVPAEDAPAEGEPADGAPTEGELADEAPAGEPLVEDMPAPRRLEEPIDPMAAGAVPMVPAAPPPRATRIESRFSRGAGRGAPVRDGAARASSRQRYRVNLLPEQEGQAEEAPAAEEAAAPEEAPESKPRINVAERLQSLFQRFSGSLGAWAVVAAACLVAAAAALSFIMGISTSWFGPLAPPDENVPVVQPPSDGSIEPIDQDDEEEPGEPAPSGELTERGSVEEYSWEELSQISALIADAPSDEEAREIAVSYNLCNPDGTLDGGQAKAVELSDGTTVSFAVAGFRHDDRADGSGKAGISFVARDLVSTQAYDPSGDPPAWEDAPLRSWANQSLMGLLPAELAEVVIPVKKTTSLPTDLGGGVQETEELMWVLSLTEVDGSPSGGVTEGAQYQLFSDMGVGDGGSSFLVIENNFWWERTPSENDSRWVYSVDPSGQSSYGRNPAQELGVIVGFCL